MRYWLQVGFLVLGASCADAVGPSGPLRVETSAAVFTIPAGGQSVAIGFVTRNLGSNPVYVARCGERLMAAVERWESTEWVQFSGDGCLAIYDTSPVAINAGERREDIRSIQERGIYRLRLGTAGDASQAPVWDLVSNTFEIR